MKTVEEIAIEKHLSDLQFPDHTSSYLDWVKFGLQESQRWIPMKEEKPPVGEQVLCKNKNWIDEDFNPNGIRIGFRTDEDFITAHWWDYQDTYMTISHIDCDGNESFSENIKNNIEPTHWRPINRI